MDLMKKAEQLCFGQRWQEAGECYLEMLENHPEKGLIYYLYGNCLRFQGEMSQALSAYRRSVEEVPHFIAAQWALCMSLFKEIYTSHEELISIRKEYGKRLLLLHEWVMRGDGDVCRQLLAHLGLFHPFYLPYQGAPSCSTSDLDLSDRDLQKLYGEIAAKVMGWNYPRCAHSDPGAASVNEKLAQSGGGLCIGMPCIGMPRIGMPRIGMPLRVGFVSRFFFRHSVWRMPLGGWLEKLKGEEIEIFCYQTHNIEDSVTLRAKELADHWVEGLSESQLIERIQSDQLDVLIYPEIGMDPVTIRLSALRLAPIQCASWGHPVSSGMPSIDYYLSSELMELEGAQAHYSERLVRLRGLSVVLFPERVAPSQRSPMERAVRSDSIKYLCCQSLYKYLPEHDWIWPAIARAIAKAQFIIIDCEPALTEQFYERLRPAFAAQNRKIEEHVIKLPWLSLEEMASVYMQCDLFLDSIGWSGCNTSLEAIEYNLPIITLPQEVMRSRHTSAFLNKMGVTSCMATSVDEYVQLAIEAGSNRAWRRELSSQIEHAKWRLYGDTAPIEDLKSWLLSKVFL